MTTTRTRRTVPGILFLVICSTLVVWNLFAIARNQRSFGDEDVIRTREVNLGILASRHPMHVISETFSAYYKLRMFAGERLDVTVIRGAHRWALEHVSRIDVRIVPMPLILPRPATEKLFRAFQYWWSLEVGVPLAVLRIPGITHYVLVQRDDLMFDMIMPEFMYRAALADVEKQR